MVKESNLVLVKSSLPSQYPILDISMPFLFWHIVSLGIIHMCNASHVQSQSVFINEYKDAIEDFTMVGHQNGWNHCDILSDGFLIQGIPHISMELDRIKDLDTKSVLASSHCLLIVYYVQNQASLKSLIEFGQVTFQHKRLALVIRLASGLKLDIGPFSKTKLPFLVVIEWEENQKRQFICPVVGETTPHWQLNMCAPSQASYENKTLQIGIIGLKPYFVHTETGRDGIDIRMINMLAKKLRFSTNFIAASSFFASPNMVCMRLMLLQLPCA